MGWFQSAKLRAAVVALFVFMLSFTVAVRDFSQPFSVRGGLYSDHFSHMCSTILFLAKGLDIYRKPVKENLERSTQPKDLQFARDNDLGTEELFVNPLDARRPPLAINWSFQIRPYPPGVYALFLPIALPFQYDKLSFRNANRLIISLLTVASALAIFFAFLFVFEDRASGLELGIRVASAGFAAYWIQYWALRGFYDVVSILFVLLCLRALKRKHWLDSFFFYSCAVFIHYRALYYAPVAALAIFYDRHLVREWFKKTRFWAALAMALASALCFWVALPQLETFAGNNPLYRFWSHFSQLDASSALDLGLGLCALGFTAFAREWDSFAIALCYWVFLVRTPQTYPWHSLFLLPLLVLCSRGRESLGSRAQWVSMAAMIGWLGHSVYGAW